MSEVCTIRIDRLPDYIVSRCNSNLDISERSGLKYLPYADSVTYLIKTYRVDIILTIIEYIDHSLRIKDININRDRIYKNNIYLK